MVPANTEKWMDGVHAPLFTHIAIIYSLVHLRE